MTWNGSQYPDKKAWERVHFLLFIQEIVTFERKRMIRIIQQLSQAMNFKGERVSSWVK